MYDEIEANNCVCVGTANVNVALINPAAAYTKTGKRQRITHKFDVTVNNKMSMLNEQARVDLHRLDILASIPYTNISTDN